MIIWGYKGYQKELGQTRSQIRCQHCDKVETWQILESGRRFTLYWIPLFPYGKKYFVSCPICHYGKEIGKEEINEFLNY